MTRGATASVAAVNDRHLFSGHVAMIGAGQLARMTQQAAVDLSVLLEVLAKTDLDPAVLAGARHRVGSALDPAAVFEIGESADVTTLDHELVSLEGLHRLESTGCRVAPSASALRFAQDKEYARHELSRRGFPVPRFMAVSGAGDVTDFASETGWPVVMKAATMGYDGRGVEIVADPGAAEQVLASGGTWIVEEMVDLEMELAVLVARRPSGDAVTYPVVETVQVDGICRELVMPARVTAPIHDAAIDLALSVVESVDATGIVAVELFLSTDGALLINELALRPHNSGHATIEGSVTSQFHNHLRACLDWPLGATRMVAGSAAMVNLLGTVSDVASIQNLPNALGVDGASIHLYAKEERRGRKIGHVTALAEDGDEALEIARRAAAVLEGRT